MILKDSASAEFLETVVKQLYWDNGPYCPVCDKRIFADNSIFYLKGVTVDVHHIRFKDNGGLGTYGNGIVCCRKCHIKIHRFMAIFNILAKDYELFTTFYVTFFLANSDDFLNRKNNKLLKRFNYKKYSKSKRSFARLFKEKMKRQSVFSNMLLTYYMYYDKRNNYYNPIIGDYVSTTFSQKKFDYLIYKKRKTIFLSKLNFHNTLVLTNKAA